MDPMGPEDMSVNLAQLQSTLEESGAQWSARETPLSQLSIDEKRLRLGYVPGPEEPSLPEREQMATAQCEVHEAARSRAMEVGYPASFDWRNVAGKNFITSVKDQGGCGACVAFGTIATVEGTLRVQLNDPNKQIDYSEAHLFYCLARAQGRRCSGASGGWWVGPALDCFKNPGVSDNACYPYTSGDQDCTNLCSDWQNRVTKISGWHSITNVADMKTWLSTKGPLATCFSVYNDFFNYSSGIYHYVSGAYAGGHCVSCVGYSDTGQYWICKNSWASTWGEQGFFRIAYGQVGIDAEMWAVDGVVVTQPAGQWLNNVRIIGLWATEGDRNGWAYVDGTGWRKITTDNDNIFFNMLIHLAAAKAAARPVNLFIEQNVIKQVYVL
ncbi:MAG: C1 family peptidase [Pyrinomonadaceae bacterium]